MENEYQYQDDKIEIKEYIDKNFIFKYLTEEQIFSNILGFEPKEYEYICSPLRVDNNPGAFFQRGTYSNKLLFMDYADPFKICYDCFDFVQRYYNLPDFYQTLKFVKEHMIEKRGITKILQKRDNKIQRVEKKSPELIVEVRPFVFSDGIYWEKYGISKENLKEDKVFAISKVFLKNGRKGDKRIPLYTKCYGFMDFPDKKKKLYFPYKKGRFRFISTCTKNDVIISYMDKTASQLVISKSYKDCRVLRNLKVNSIWFQNEGAFPDNLQEIVSNFQDVVVFFDNDTAGIEASEKLVELINTLFGTQKARKVHLNVELLSDGIKDPADMFSKKGVEDLKSFLTENNIKHETNRHNT